MRGILMIIFVVWIYFRFLTVPKMYVYQKNAELLVIAHGVVSKGTVWVFHPGSIISASQGPSTGDPRHSIGVSQGTVLPKYLCWCFSKHFIDAFQGAVLYSIRIVEVFIFVFLKDTICSVSMVITLCKGLNIASHNNKSGSP